MTPLDRRKPPDGRGGLSLNVLADGFDTPRDNPTSPKNQQATLPPDFDASVCPILALHFFGVEPVHEAA